MSRDVNKRIEEAVKRRAGFRCEYCHVHERFDDLPHVLDHIVARQHHGTDSLANLALSCGRCNAYKGPNIAGIDARTGELSRLFHPRTDEWKLHFRWNRELVVGLTPVGRTTVDVLAINHPSRIAARSALLASGRVNAF